MSIATSNLMKRTLKKEEPVKWLKRRSGMLTIVIGMALILAAALAGMAEWQWEP